MTTDKWSPDGAVSPPLIPLSNDSRVETQRKVFLQELSLDFVIHIYFIRKTQITIYLKSESNDYTILLNILKTYWF